jgi:DNA-binding CsgD family transcriptional regulator
MRVAQASIVGRERELETISSFFDKGSATGDRALVLEGVAGIGKTTLWREATRMAGRAGYRVLEARPTAAEAGLTFSALDDLLAGSIEEISDSMPAPQVTALEIAFFRRAADGGSADPHALSLGALGALRALATTGPLIVAIDDVQWLDRGSAATLAFALRRLDEEPVRLIASRRDDPALPASALLEAVTSMSVTRVGVGPLSETALHHMIRMHLGRTLPRPVLLRVHQLSAGNPFFALELARALPEPPDREPVLPETLDRLTRGRLARLPARVRRVLEPIALLARPTVTVIERLQPNPDALALPLDKAVAAGVIELETDGIRFTHPLLAEATSSMIGPRRRRALHQQLAEAVADPEERARHLALGSVGPSVEVASTLDEAARRARSRGAPEAAAELVELARRLTPPDDDVALRRRGLEAAQYHFDAGDATRATHLLREIIASSPPGPERARLLFRLSSMSWMDLLDGVRDPALQALGEAGDDLELRSGVHGSLAWLSFYTADLVAAAEHAHKSMQFANKVSDVATRADAAATLDFIRFVRGRPSEDLMSIAVDLQDRAMSSASWTEAGVFTPPRSTLGLELMWSGRLDAARQVLTEELAGYEEHGVFTSTQEVLCYLSEVESRAGRWHEAGRYAADGTENLIESGRRGLSGQMFLFAQSLAAAHLGQVEDARAWATEGAALGDANDDPFYGNSNRAVLGFLELSMSRHEQALGHLEPVVAYLDRLDAAEPAIMPCMPDYIEALIHVGRVDDAERRIELLEERGSALDRPWALAAARRCRGLVALTRGDADTAVEALGGALVEHRRTAQPFERARTLLALGEAQRRSRQRRLARRTLDEALASFSELGADLWEERAATEVGRIGGRSSIPDELTPSERRIVQLVSEGRTNKEVATALMLAERTVESALTKVYRKLGIRSRTELARWMASSD